MRSMDHDTPTGARGGEVVVNERHSRAHGCLAGVALGDALGRATEFMTREQIRARFGWLDGFATPGVGHPGHANPLGAVTDDTVQTLLIARVVIHGRPLTAERVAAALVAWARDNDGLNDPYIGPSTRRALRSLMDGASPYETGRKGTTNGGSMRVAAIGIADSADFDAVLRDVSAASTPTHNTRNGMQGAASAAFAVAAAMRPGATVDDVVDAAKTGARRGRVLGEWSWATPLDKRIELAARIAHEADSLDAALQGLYDYVGVGLDPAESVASAVGLVVAARGDPMTAILGGANIGGDTDTIAALAGAICGAMRGVQAVDAGMLGVVEAVNGLDLAGVARALTGDDA